MQSNTTINLSDTGKASARLLLDQGISEKSYSLDILKCLVLLAAKNDTELEKHLTNVEWSDDGNDHTYVDAEVKKYFDNQNSQIPIQYWKPSSGYPNHKVYDPVKEIMSIRKNSTESDKLQIISLLLALYADKSPDNSHKANNAWQVIQNPESTYDQKAESLNGLMINEVDQHQNVSSMGRNASNIHDNYSTKLHI